MRSRCEDDARAFHAHVVDLQRVAMLAATEWLRAGQDLERVSKAAGVKEHIYEHAYGKVEYASEHLSQHAKEVAEQLLSKAEGHFKRLAALLASDQPTAVALELSMGLSGAHEAPVARPRSGVATAAGAAAFAVLASLAPLAKRPLPPAECRRPLLVV